jgi:hypothetical protein
MEFAFIIVLLVALDIAAMRWGHDSRGAYRDAGPVAHAHSHSVLG